MKLCLDRDCLVDAVSVVAPAVPRRPPSPVLAGIRLRAEPDMVSVAGFDYEISSHTRIVGAEVNESGQVLVSGRLLTEVAKALPARPVEMSHNGDGLEIVCGQSRFALPLMAIDEYPELPSTPPTAGAVDQTGFCDAVAQVAVAAGRDDTLPMLTGINLEFHPGFLRLVSTDRFRIAIRELEWQPADPINNEPGASMLVPARALAETSKALAGPRIEIAAGPSRTILGLTTGAQHHTLRTLDMPYAPYHSYLEDNRTSTARLDSAALVEAIKRVSLLSSRGTQVRLTFTAATTRLSAGSDTEGKAEETIACEFDGEPLTVAFNPRYLLEGLAAIHAESVEIALNGPTRAARLRTAHHRPDEQLRDGLSYVLMPVRLPGDGSYAGSLRETAARPQ
ncbi:DNA polymerase III subunit beta [Nocardia sp. CNY236]|uniref:DNA polymerase III subunit beta n=1 Tax=Nocardia sp. CNY236 TaxID=1169152 RepID=UPI0004126594|nr:DNA polymerase III subunit beta [Nocardia sp. CNY236]